MLDSDSVKLNIHCCQWHNYDITFGSLKLERFYSSSKLPGAHMETCCCVDTFVLFIL